MIDEQVLEILKSVGAIIIDDHIVYTSGRHGSVYVNKDALYPHIAETSQLCEELASRVASLKPDVVAAPALGGIVLTQWVAHHLSTLLNTPPLAVYAEKSGDELVLKRGYDKIVKGKRVLVLEDILNTGGSAVKAIAVVKSVGGNVVGLGALVNRQPTKNTTESFGVPLTVLTDFPAETYEANDCPLCTAKVPINTSVGHGRAFVKSS